VPSEGWVGVAGPSGAFDGQCRRGQQFDRTDRPKSSRAVPFPPSAIGLDREETVGDIGKVIDVMDHLSLV